MSVLGPVGEALSVVFVCFLLVLAGELYYLYYWKRRRRRLPPSLPSSSSTTFGARAAAAAGAPSSADHQSRHTSPEIIYYLLCWKRKHFVGGIVHQHHHHHRHDQETSSSSFHDASSTLQSAAALASSAPAPAPAPAPPPPPAPAPAPAAAPAPSSSSPPPVHSDLVAKLFPVQGEDVDDGELDILQLHGLLGPPRLLFTITEETKEDLDSEDARSAKLCPSRSRRGSQASSDGGFCITPFVTPPSSPPPSPPHPAHQSPKPLHAHQSSFASSSSFSSSSSNAPTPPLLATLAHELPSSFSPSTSSSPTTSPALSSPPHPRSPAVSARSPLKSLFEAHNHLIHPPVTPRRIPSSTHEHKVSETRGIHLEGVPILGVSAKSLSFNRAPPTTLGHKFVAGPFKDCSPSSSPLPRHSHPSWVTGDFSVTSSPSRSPSPSTSTPPLLSARSSPFYSSPPQRPFNVPSPTR